MGGAGGACCVLSPAVCSPEEAREGQAWRIEGELQVEVQLSVLSLEGQQ